ncbi:hypothetical protein NDU88_003947 [Pleurodeles waltl]|uniref:Uncharacterized protein n=1 Tax=Pleurodeles waltl TaxID=8319 RepID=A0AAV7RK04_PLEWA|nr:hypothetical protein NDU88_003947 [Pleurodeles waltl]
MVSYLEVQVKILMAKVHELESRAEDSEGRSGCINIGMLAFQKDLVTFFETWLARTVAPTQLSTHYLVEWANRVRARRPPEGASPRSVEARLMILRAGRTAGSIVHKNGRIALFPDYTLAVPRLRASVLGVKKRLWSVGLSYTLLLPTKLKVMVNRPSYFFTEPEDDWEWVEQQQCKVSVLNTLTTQPQMDRAQQGIVEAEMQESMAPHPSPSPGGTDAGTVDCYQLI